MRHDSAGTADGTQPSEPSWTFADPLAGVSSGEEHRSASAGTTPHRRDTDARPTAPNPENVRALLNDVYAPASERATADEDPIADTDTDTAESADVASADVASADAVETDDGGMGDEGAPVTPVERSSEQTRPGMLPTQRRTWPRRRRLTRQAWRPRGRIRARRRTAPSQQQPSLKTSRGFAGVTVAILLLLLFCVVAVQFVVSFISMFTG